MPTQATTEKLTKATMKRLKGFDYSKPYFYMVTLKRLPEQAALSPRFAII